MNNLLLIDGTSILFRAFYGLSHQRMMSTKEGVFTNAIFGFLNTMDKFIKSEKPTHILVAFDVKGKNFRHDLFSEYKAGRKETPEELISQFPLIKQVLTAMNISTIEMKGQEADDLIGTYKHLAEQASYKVTVLTGDRDMIQLVSNNTTVKIPTTLNKKPIVNEFTAKSLFEKMGITAEEFIHVKALMGDKSDNIPGVAGVGEKTAIKLIIKYHSIKNLYENIDEISSENLKNKLLKDSDKAFLSYDLSAINLQAPSPMELDELVLEPYNKEALYNLFTTLEFNYFIKKYNLSKIISKSVTYNIKNISSLDEMNIKSEATVFLTKSELQITFDGETLYILTDFSLLSSIFSLIKYISGHYLKELFVKLMEKQITIPKVLCDVATAAYLLDATKDYYDLIEIFNQYATVNVIEDCHEAIRIFHIKKALLKKIDVENMTSLLNDMELPLIEVLAYMEFIGVKADKEFLQSFNVKLESELKIIEQDIYNMAGSTFNLNSPKQLGKVLFEDLQLPHGKKNKTGYSTSIKVLEKLAIDHIIASKIIKYRQLKKLQSTYVEGLLKCIADDGRIHSNFKQTVTATGRISSTEPNLQNLPIRSELGREIRKAFVCESDKYILLGADYSQIELRILAHISKDKTLVEAFTKKEDIHTKTAAKVFGVDERMVTSGMRRTAKAVNFGIVYGISDFGLSRDLNISVPLAKQYISQYLHEYKMVKKYMEDTVKFAIDNGYVLTIFNRKRHIKELQSPNYMQREFGKRIALNTPIQGAAADVMKIAMIKVYNQLKKMKLKSRLILQIHDELIIETHIDEVDIVKGILKKHMTNSFSLKVPLTIDISDGKSLYEAK